MGWQDWVSAPVTSGTTGQHRRLEAFEVATDIEGLSLALEAHVSDVGWLPPVPENTTCGTTGQFHAIEAIKATLTGPLAPNYDLWYHLHIQDYGWLGWAKNGEPCGTEGGGIQAEAVCFYLAPKNSVSLEVNTNWSYLKIEPVVPTPPPVTPTLTPEQKRNNMVAVASTQIGYLSDPDEGESSIYGDYFGTPATQYCAQFVLWCAYQNGLGDLFPHTAYVPDAVSWYLNHETAYFYRYGQYLPVAGDQVFFDYNQNGTPDHTGLVIGCDGVALVTIEGNTGSPRGVYKKTYDLTDPYVASQIYGFGIPDYS